MAVDFDKGIRPNVYELMQGGGGGELQPATADTLGGVKIGRGIDVTEDGTISVTAPAPIDTYTKEEIDEQQEAQDYNINSNALAIERLETAIDDTYTKEEIDTQQQTQNTNIANNAAAISSAQSAISDIQDEQVTQNTNINVNAQSILSLQNSVTTIQGQQQTQDTNIANNTSAISELEDEIESLTTDYYTKSEINTQQQTQDTAISINAQNIATIQSNISSIQAEQQTQNTNIASNTSAISELEDEIESLTTDYYTKSEIDTQQQTQDTAISINAQNIATIQSNISSIQAEQQTQNTNIASNTSAISTLQTNLSNETSARTSADSALQDNIDSNTSAITTLSTQIADDNTLGLVKTNTSKFISTDENGVLQIGGRLGQFSNEEMPDGGLYYPLSISPEVVWKNSFLITEGTLISTRSSRIFALAAGANITLKTAAAAGATRFEVSNTFANRFTCAMARNGYATIQEGTAGTIMVHVTNVYLANDTNKTPLVPYSGATESRNNIVIETDAPLSDTDAVTKLRLYGTMTFDSSFHCGQGNGTGGVTGKGKLLQLGQSQLSLDGNSILIGNSIFNAQNRCIIVGAYHINFVQGACLTGTGHDTTNAKFIGLAAHGQYSDIGENTAFAIGNGTNNTTRSNLFEIADENGATAIMVKSPNDTEFKITVDNNGNLVTTQV